MNKLLSIISAVAALAGCATMAPAPAGLKDGAFTAFDCDGGDFQARWSASTNTVRVRSHHGAAELSPSGDTTAYSGDGYVLRLAGSEGISLSHDGKVVSRNCKKV